MRERMEIRGLKGTVLSRAVSTPTFFADKKSYVHPDALGQISLGRSSA